MHTLTTSTLVLTQVLLPQEEAGGGASALFKLDPGLMIWTWIVFFVLLFLLSKFGLRPMIEAIQQREKKISDAMRQAEQTRQEAAESEERRRAILAEAQNQAEALITEARKQARQEAQLILDDAKNQSQKLQQDAVKQIEREKHKAMEDLKERIIDLIIGSSSTLVSAKFDAAQHRDTVNEYLDKL